MLNINANSGNQNAIYESQAIQFFQKDNKYIFNNYVYNNIFCASFGNK